MADRFEFIDREAGLLSPADFGRQSPMDWVSEAMPAVRVFANALMDNPEFLGKTRCLADQLTRTYDANPRLGKVLGSHRRWFMTQAGFALHGSSSTDGHGGLTATRMTLLMERYGVASRNTVSSFIAELQAYHFLCAVPGTEGRRIRLLMPTNISTAAMHHWLTTNLAAIDLLDGGDRHAVFATRPQLLNLIQGCSVRLLLECPDWLTPDPQIMNFLGMESGGLVLDGLISVIDLSPTTSGQMALGKLNLSKIARRFQISRVNVDRVFRKALDNGTLGRDSDGAYWMSAEFLKRQARRQALKLAVINYAFHWALAQRDEHVALF